MVTAEITFSRKDLIGLKHPMMFVGVDWETYVEVSEEIGESSSLHQTFNKGNLTIKPTTEIHELLTGLLHDFIRFAGFALRMNVIATGKATMRSKRRNYGVEPDLSYFVSKADIHQAKNYVPNEMEMPPDIVVEIDIHHPSDDKFEIYAEFGVSEFWQYDGEKLKIYKLQSGEYREIEKSEELPILTSEILSEFLKRGQTEQQFTVLADFQNWLQENK
ncbi:MAG TPA: Uma2 family endonuclease [Pyrinomonadaceae bacterium]|jgi:Uma2 family endonuclease